MWLWENHSRAAVRRRAAPGSVTSRETLTDMTKASAGSGAFRFCENIFAEHGANKEFWSARSTARWCSEACKADWHKRLREARALLAGEEIRNHQRRTSRSTTTTADAWAELGSRAGDYDSYQGRMRATAETAYRCEYEGCGKAFQAATRQSHCSLACRDADARRRP